MRRLRFAFVEPYDSPTSEANDLETILKPLGGKCQGKIWRGSARVQRESLHTYPFRISCRREFSRRSLERKTISKRLDCFEFFLVAAVVLGKSLVPSACAVDESISWTVCTLFFACSRDPTSASQLVPRPHAASRLQLCRWWSNCSIAGPDHCSCNSGPIHSFCQPG